MKENHPPTHAFFNYDQFYFKTDWKNIAFHIKILLKTLLNLLKIIHTGKRIQSVLDVGCGTGSYTYTFSKLGFDTVGIDFSKVAISKAREKYPHIKFIQQDAHQLELNQKFDLFFSKGFTLLNTSNVIDVHNLLVSWSKFLNPGGIIVIISRTNFSKKSPSNWYFHSEEEIRDHFTLAEYETHVFYIYSKLQYFLLSPILIDFQLKMINWVSKNIVIKRFKKPVNYFVFLKKKEL